MTDEHSYHATLRTREDIFAAYVLPEVAVLLRVALGMTAQPADAEDLVQETLMRAFAACDRFDGAHPRAWLLTILRHTHANRARRQRPGLLDYPGAHEGDRVGWPGGAEPLTPEQLVVDARYDAAVAEALGSLSEEQRWVIALVDVEGLSYAQAARALDLPEGTVMSRLHRARRRIRDRLAVAGLAPQPRHRGVLTGNAGR